MYDACQTRIKVSGVIPAFRSCLATSWTSHSPVYLLRSEPYTDHRVRSPMPFSRSLSGSPLGRERSSLSLQSCLMREFIRTLPELTVVIPISKTLLPCLENSRSRVTSIDSGMRSLVIFVCRSVIRSNSALLVHCFRSASLNEVNSTMLFVAFPAFVAKPVLCSARTASLFEAC
jgi:hypothetical protein